MTERATVNQRVQIAKETTPGTAVPATKLLENLNFATTPHPEVKTYRPTGRRFVSVAEMNREWTEIKADGMLDYQDFVYLVSSPWGAATISTHPSGTNSKDWLWTPAVTGAIAPVTYTIEQGDAVRAHKMAYCFATGFGYKGTRKDGFTVTAPFLAQAFSDNITMTSSPTAVALSPVAGSHVNLYIDLTSGGIGVTQFTRAFSFEYSYDSANDAFWPLNRANASFTGTVDLAPKNTVKFLLEADSNGMSLYPHLQAGDFVYVRFGAQGGVIETTIHYGITHDMCIKLTTVSDFKDEAGIYATEYTGEIAEDSTWNSGQAQTMTVTNQLTGL